ncbi:MAG: CPBP family intramembrane metalloprotease [Ruminococcus flavefaciens]|nr:CPBP family intramembrane metalloprotease [Ruminococcus flavefaciens]
MKSYLKQLSRAFVMLIAGLCPMGLGMVFIGIFGEKYATLIMDLSLFVGAVLCALVMKKEFDTRVKEFFKMPKPDELLLVVAMSLVYTVITALTEYREVLSEPSDEIYSIADWAGTAVLAPVSEEIIFRFSMLTLLLVSAGRGKKIFSFGIVSAVWAVVHFGGTLPRFIDIFIVGIILSIIFTESGNIIYCMVFHSIANISIYIVSRNSLFLVNKIWLLYVSIPLFVALMGMLVYIFNKRKIVKE